MAKTLKSKKISITTLDNIKKEIQVSTKNINWHGIEVAVKNTLSLRDVLAFVNSVWESCFMGANNDYLPEVKIFAIKSCAIEMYTNLTLPTDAEHKYDLIYNTDIFDVLLEHIDTKQFNEIIGAIDDKIDNSNHTNAEAINRQIVEICNSLSNLEKQMADIFTDISPEQMSNFIDTISTGVLDEEKIVKACIANSSN